MKPEDEKKFLLLMSKLAIAFREKITNEQGKLFMKYLIDFEIDRIERAVDRAIMELKWFPKIAEIREFILEDLQNDYIKAQTENLQIEWMEPTEKGREFAKEMIKGLKEKWEKQEKEEENDRVIRFEKRREELRKQAKMIK